MDIEARIRRRRRRDEASRLVREYAALSPVDHVDEPSDRGSVLERLLDHLDPVFDGKLPPNGYVYGPPGSGKSATVTALFAALDRLSTGSPSTIHTSTRAPSSTDPRFAFVDLRGTTSEFTFYHDVLDGLVDEPVPEHGVSTDDLRTRLGDVLGGSEPGVVVAVDHVDDPNTPDPETLTDLFAGLPSNVSWLALGRSSPDAMPLTTYTAASIGVDPYRTQTLVDLLMARATDGLRREALTYELAREIAAWAEGNAHDALAALLVATEIADGADRMQLAESDVAAAIEEFPDSSVSLARVLALPPNKQAVLRELVDLEGADLASVSATTDAISSGQSIDLTPGTVKRFLYEIADAGILDRVQSDVEYDRGRPPSRVKPRFPPTAFRRLYDLRQ